MKDGQTKHLRTQIWNQMYLITTILIPTPWWKGEKNGNLSFTPLPMQQETKSTYNPSQTDNCYEYIVDKYKKKDNVTRDRGCHQRIDNGKRESGGRTPSLHILSPHNTSSVQQELPREAVRTPSLPHPRLKSALLDLWASPHSRYTNNNARGGQPTESDRRI